MAQQQDVEVATSYMSLVTTNPFKEIQFVLSLIQFEWNEFQYLNKKHTCIGFAICALDYICSSRTISISSHFYAFYHSICEYYQFSTVIVVIYFVVESILYVLFLITIQHILCTLYWTRRYRNDQFRNSILLHSDHTLSPLDGFIMIYPWILCPILMCNVILDLAIELTFYFGATDSDLWLYHIARSSTTLIAYCSINEWIGTDLKRKRLFTMDPVIRSHTKLCLFTTRSLLGHHLLYIDGLTDIVMEYIGPDPLPQFRLIKLKLMQSIQRLDIDYVSRLTTFVVTVYSIIKIYFHSHYDENERDGHSNIFVSIATVAGVVLFGHTVRKLGLSMFYVMVRVFTMNIPSASWYARISMVGVCVALIAGMVWRVSYWAEDCDQGVDIWAAVIFDNVLAEEYEYLFPVGTRVYLRWIRAGFTQLGYIVLSALFGLMIRLIMASSYGKARWLKVC